MKRNKQTVKASRKAGRYEAGRTGNNSDYAKKVQSGNQLYGPGCCAHTKLGGAHHISAWDAGYRPAAVTQRSASYGLDAHVVIRD